MPLENVYNYEPLHPSLTPEQQKHIIGVQANLWTEYITSYRHVEYMELPRMAALCEVQWCNPASKNLDDFKQRLLPMVDMYDVKGYNYAHHLFDIEGVITTDTVQNAVVVTLRTIDDAPIHYTLDGSEPTTSSARYKAPVAITGTSVFKAKGMGERSTSRVFEEHVSFNKATGRPITLLQPSHRSYTFGGASTLVDGLKGNRNYRTGRWLGFAGNDCELLIDLQQSTQVSTVSLSTCVEKGDWIFDARGFSIAVSKNGTDFTEVYHEQRPAMEEADANRIYDHILTFTPIEARYVKVKVMVEHSIPAWHGARGYSGFLFIDEVEVE